MSYNIFSPPFFMWVSLKFGLFWAEFRAEFPPYQAPLWDSTLRIYCRTNHQSADCYYTHNHQDVMCLSVSAKPRDNKLPSITHFMSCLKVFTTEWIRAFSFMSCLPTPSSRLCGVSSAFLPFYHCVFFIASSLNPYSPLFILLWLFFSPRGALGPLNQTVVTV